jgi:hemerythrin
MPLLEWTDRLSVGVDEFDSHHKRMIALLNELHEAMSEGRGQDALSGILGELIEYTDYHFAAEERAFDEHGYPDADAHREAHAKLLEKARSLKDQYDSGTTMMSLEVIEFLKSWVTDHIKGEDTQYTEFFNQRGVG